MNKISDKIRKFLAQGSNIASENSKQVAFDEEYFGHRITLIDKGEIRFGPPYFDMLIDNAKITNKTFGMNVWMLDDHLFGAEEWLTTSEQNGPLTRLVLFNLRKMECATMKQINGFPECVRIHAPHLQYNRRENNSTIEVEITLEEIKNWSPIFGARW